MAQFSGGQGRRTGKRRVWRITPNAPRGEYIEIDLASNQVTVSVDFELPEGADIPTEPGWLMSSWDLARGLEVSDQGDTIPAELFDELFKKER